MRERPPELLAPAGDEAALRAALAAGADAVYLGMERWSARAYAGNFDARALVAAIDLTHLFGARAHLALNTLLKPDELAPALQALESPYRAGLDAVLVADLGLAAGIRQRFPDLALHASTQLNTHSSAQLAALAALGFTRAVLARELSLDEIRALDPDGLEIEVFVHGALCYGYSGLCLFSSMVGGRSGNRGRCAQACRMRYRMTAARSDAGMPDSGSGGWVDDAPAIEGRVLSAADLAAIGVLPQLVAAGVRALKIEGRMKDAVYVATAVGVYREALDAALADPDSYAVRQEWLERLEQSFSRGFTLGHLDARHGEVRSGGRGGHRGVLVGRVERMQKDGGVVVRLARTLHSGDVVCLYTSRGQTEPVRLQEGGADRITLRVDEPVSPKDRLFRIAAAAVDGPARDAVAGRRVARPLPLAACLRGEEGRPARLEMSLLPAGALAAAVASTRLLEPATAAALDADRARPPLAALGGTPYELRELVVDVGPDLFLPVAELRDLRRRAVAIIDEKRLAGHRRRGPSPSPSAQGVGHVPLSAAAGGAGSDAAVPVEGLRRSPAGRAVSGVSEREPPVVLRLRPDVVLPWTSSVEVVCLDLTVADEPASLAAVLADLQAGGRTVRCRPPALLFDGDEEWWREVAALPWDGVYARHAAHLGAAAPVILEHPLQGLSAGSAGVLGSAGLALVAGAVASPELTLVEVAELASALAVLRPPVGLEILAFGRQEVLLTRDRLGESEGLVSTQAPGEHVHLLLEDAKGFRFPAAVDARGTSIANARVTNLTRHLAELSDAGVRAFVVDPRAMDSAERAAFHTGGLAALARFAARDRATTGHLFRGVQ